MKKLMITPLRYENVAFNLTNGKIKSLTNPKEMIY